MYNLVHSKLNNFIFAALWNLSFEFQASLILNKRFYVTSMVKLFVHYILKVFYSIGLLKVSVLKISKSYEWKVWFWSKKNQFKIP